MFELNRRQQLLILVIAAVILFGAGYKYALWQVDRSKPAEKPAVEFDEKDQMRKPAREIVVHVTGAVDKPGVYRLPEGARVNDAIAQALPQAEADLQALNLAAPLNDGQKIMVPLKQPLSQIEAGGAGQTGRSSPFAQPAEGVHAGASGGAIAGGKVNINTAGLAELDTLPGIGPSLAQRIIQYREENGPFKSPEDIKNVSGIGEKRYDQLKDLISVY